MKISIVTISFNQAKYLRECIDSVMLQDYKNFEYFIVDPGSTDGSRAVIESYGDRIIKIFQKDKGPADGLNIGFGRATGDIFCYLNSDDVLLPHAFTTVAKVFSEKYFTDIVCGHGHIIDENSNYKRRVFSDSFSIKAAAYGASLVVQPSTFFRRETYKLTSGFNSDNLSNWDGELLIDMALAGARIEMLNKFLSCYRVHGQSITGTGRLSDLHMEYTHRMFERIMHRPYKKNDDFLRLYYRIKKHLKNPVATFERLKYGPIFGTQK
ncbi:MAG: glycosyltransferase [Cytophaga sp.]|nr:glycosyltransferase [Undibacterium sp.]